MATIIQDWPDQAAHKFESLNTRVTEDADGLLIEFICCGEPVRFTRNGDPNLIGAAISEHICVPLPADAL